MSKTANFDSRTKYLSKADDFVKQFEMKPSISVDLDEVSFVRFNFIEHQQLLSSRCFY